MSVAQEVLGLSDRSLPQPRPANNDGSAPAYQYQPIEENDCIRILRLAPGKPNDPLKGTLEVVKIDSAGSYEPVSYVWQEPGPPNCRHEILLCDDNKEQLLQLAGGSLLAALNRIRLPDLERRVWADQICINQKDSEERSQQVQFMNRIYAKAKHVLVWLGMDKQNDAKSAFDQIDQIDKKLDDQTERVKFRDQYTRDLEKQSSEEWKALDKLTSRLWFKRCWIVQEIGTRAPATMFWGSAEIEWVVLHSVCEKLTDYHHLRNKFNIRTSDIKFLFQRFIQPDESSYHANRFNFLYELHRARGLKVTDPRDRVFAFLGHYALTSVHHHKHELAAIKADYNKNVHEVYIDVAVRALRGSQGDSALIALAAVQHNNLPPRPMKEDQAGVETTPFARTSLPSWVPDWTTYQGFILSEPISPHWAHGASVPNLEIVEDSSILKIHGLKIDIVAACSRVLRDREFHSKRDQNPKQPLPMEYLWREICQKECFNIRETYPNGQTAFFAFSQALSNGCVQIAGRESKKYNEIPESRWLEQAALYLWRATGQSDDIAPELLEIAKKAEREHDKEEWSRSANGASKNRKFARTKKGYYVLGPAVMEEGDIVCVLFGGKMPFCLRPRENRYVLVGECYTHGLMKGEAIDMMARNEVTEQVFELA